MEQAPEGDRRGGKTPSEEGVFVIRPYEPTVISMV